MAADLGAATDSGIRVQLCGDAHLVNFGMYETPERAHVFDINDFDETAPGPFEWDVKRFAASIEIAGRDLGMGAAERRTAVLAGIGTYRREMHRFADMGNLVVWYERLDSAAILKRLDKQVGHHATKRVRHGVRKGLRHNHLAAFAKLTETVDGRTRFVSRPPLIIPVEDLLDDAGRERYPQVMEAFLREYRKSLRRDRRHLIEQYQFVHIAQKVGGVGSVGTRAWITLFMGRDGSDPLILQLKEAGPSVLAPYTDDPWDGQHGRRVVEGQRMMQAASDPLLGWYHLTALDGLNHDFYVRQLWDGKASIDVSTLSPKGLALYVETCGWVLAKAHARSGPRITIAAYLGENDDFDQAIADFATRYADVNAGDHARLCEAIANGRLEAKDDDEN